MDKKWPTIDRDEYKRRLDAGGVFKLAGLYEPDQAPKGTKFIKVNLGPGVGIRFMRIMVDTPPAKC